MRIFIILFAFLFTTVHFQGVEWHVENFGNVYWILHPDSFQGDPAMSFSRPSFMSIYYLLVKLFGEIWLDDRFQMVLYFILVITTLIAIDKTVQVMGLKRVDGRMLTLSSLLIEHRILNHQSDILFGGHNASSFAQGISTWILYFIIAGRFTWKMPVMPVLMLLGTLTQIRYIWFSILLGFVTFWIERLKRHSRVLLGFAGGGVLLSGLIYYYAFLRPGDGTDPKLFDYIVNSVDKNEGNPFMNLIQNNFLFLALCLGGFFIKLPSKAVQKRVKITVLLGLVVWLFGGLYLTYSPDILKIPYLAPFSPVMSLWWPQYILYLSFSVFALVEIEAASTWKRRLELGTLLLILYLLPFSPLNIKVSAVCGVLFTFLLIPIFLKRLKAPGPKLYYLLLTVSFCAATFLFHGVRIYRRWPAFSFLMKHGIIGDHPGAKWVLVNEYFRTQTPTPATVIALSEQRYPIEPKELDYDESLRIRSGRSMPIHFSPVPFYLDYQNLMRQREQRGQMGEFVQKWKAHDIPGIFEKLKILGSPDYLVVPKMFASWLNERSDFEYRHAAEINDFAILKQR